MDLDNSSLAYIQQYRCVIHVQVPLYILGVLLSVL